MKIFLFLLQIVLVHMALAQNGVVRGVVRDQKTNQPVPFANVVVQNSTIGSVTDFDGNFVISGLSNGFVRLQVSSVGYTTKISPEIMVTNSNETFIEIYIAENITTLSGVTVTAATFERNIESPVALQTIGISEIEKNPGGNRDISKIVQSFPGVGQTPAQRNDLIVRGGGANENRFFIDGIEFPNLNHFATQGASGGPASIINADFIREAKFYTGSFQVNNGNAMSSVLDMNLITPSKDKAVHRFAVGASDLALSYNGPLSGNTGLLVSYRRSYLQFLFAAIGLPFLPTYNDYLIKTKTTLKNSDEITFFSLGAYDVSRLNLERNETEEQRYLLSYLPETNQWNYTIGATYRHFKKNGYINYILSRNMFRNQSFKFQDNIEVDSLRIQDYSSDEIENKFRFENVFFTKGWRWLTGASAEYDRYSNSTYQKFFAGGSPLTLNYNSEFDFFRFAVFAQVSGKIMNNRLGVNIGLRTDANTYDDEMLNPLNQISPRLSLNYSLTERWFATVSAARYSQLPAYTTLGYSDNGVLVNKKNNLSAIGVNHFIAGVEFIPNDDSRATFEAFFKGYDNYPVSLRDSVSLANKGGDFGVVGDEPVVSSGKGRAYGFEFQYRQKVIDKLNMLFTYTFVRSEFSGLDGSFIPSAWDARHIINVLGSRNFKRNWTLGIKWKFSGGAPYTPYDEYTSSLVQAWEAQGRPYLDYDAYNTLRFKPFHQLDVRVDKEYFFNKWSLTLYMDIQNAYSFNAQSQDIFIPVSDASGNYVITNPSDPAALQRYEMKRIENSSGTLLPTVGIIVEF
ncbi:MAG TPA: TonB-dependent receptor [Bacteroidales bacterium]|nr:TonB-dependent receptor [Bacteroidales bacterium]